MAAITITVGNVALSGTGQTVVQGTAGGTVAQGDCVRVDSGNYVVANHTTSADAAVAGVALTAGGSGDTIYVVTRGKMDIGGTVTLGAAYYVGQTGGDIVPFADLASNDYVSQVGIAVSTSEIYVYPYASGAQIA